VVIVASLGAALRVAARPDAHVHGVDGRFFASGERIAGKQSPQSFALDPPPIQGGVKASPAAAVRWFEAQVSGRRDAAARAEEGVGELEEGICPTMEAFVIERVAEGA
jgi:hypothetical protein